MQRRHPLASVVFYNCIMIKRALYSSLGVTDLEQFLKGDVVIWPRCLSTEEQSCLIFSLMPWLLLLVLAACICSSIQQIFIEYLLWMRSCIWQSRWKSDLWKAFLSVARKFEDHSCKKWIARHLLHSKGWKKCRFCEGIRGFIFQLSKEEEKRYNRKLSNPELCGCLQQRSVRMRVPQQGTWLDLPRVQIAHPDSDNVLKMIFPLVILPQSEWWGRAIELNSPFQDHSDWQDSQDWKRECLVPKLIWTRSCSEKALCLSGEEVSWNITHLLCEAEV